MLTREELACYPNLTKVFNLFHTTRLTHNFYVDPNLMASVFAELGFYDRASLKFSDIPTNDPYEKQMKEIVDNL